MKDKFYGTIEELQDAVARAPFAGKWKEESTGTSLKHQFKARTGEILNWWPDTGTLHFQGQNQNTFKDKLLPILKDGLSNTPNEPNTSSTRATNTSKKIFVVHGHDKMARDQLELILRRLGLDPFILQNSESGSQTIIEALETKIYKESVMGIILMTPDDFGYSKSESEADKKSRARQNVILEMGMVMAALGRDRMFIIKKGTLEMPSDAEGIMRYEFNDDVKEVALKLVQRLQALGFEISNEQIAAASA